MTCEVKTIHCAHPRTSPILARAETSAALAATIRAIASAPTGSKA